MKIDTNTLMDPQPMLVWQVVNNGATNAVLTNQDLSFAWLEGVGFNGAQLNNTLLTDSVLINSDLRGANLTGAQRILDLHGAQMNSNTVVEGRTWLVWAVLRQNFGVGRDLHGTNLNSTILVGANFLAPI